MSKTKVLNIEKKRLNDALHKLERDRVYNDAHFVEKTTRPLFR